MKLSTYFLIFCVILPAIIMALLVYYNANIFYVIILITYVLTCLIAFFPRQAKS
jgi:hypothetical protein